MKKLLLLCLIACLSCGNDEKIVSQKHPRVNELQKEPVAAGTNLVISGKDLDDDIKIYLNGEEIIPNEIKNTEVTIKIPDNAVSGNLEINFSQVNYNTNSYLKILDEGWESFEGANYFQMDFISEKIGYAKNGNGDSHFVDKTIDGGKTWSQVLKVSSASSSIEAVTSDIAFIRTTSNVIKKTSDGGNSWQDIEAIDLGYIIKKIFFQTSTNGFLLADKLGKSDVFKTIDGGLTWNKVLELNNYSTYIEVLYNQNDDIILIDKKSKEYIFSEDNGLNWTKKSFTLPYSSNRMVYHAKKDKIWMYLEDLINIPGGLYFTDDNGSSWEMINYPKLPERIVFMNFIDESKGFMLTDEGGAFYTSDKGKTWKVFYLNTKYIYSATLFEDHLFISDGNQLLTKKLQ